MGSSSHAVGGRGRFWRVRIGCSLPESRWGAALQRWRPTDAACDRGRRGRREWRRGMLQFSMPACGPGAIDPRRVGPGAWRDWLHDTLARILQSTERGRQRGLRIRIFHQVGRGNALRSQVHLCSREWSFGTTWSVGIHRCWRPPRGAGPPPGANAPGYRPDAGCPGSVTPRNWFRHAASVRSHDNGRHGFCSGIHPAAPADGPPDHRGKTPTAWGRNARGRRRIREFVSGHWV